MPDTQAINTAEAFNIYTAIDIMDEKCVRLEQGDFDVSTTYNKDPVFAAKRWESLGAKFLHVIDLDGARTGLRSNFGVIEKIINETKIPIQVGGGIRRLDSVERYLDAGASRVIFGSIAVKEPEIVKTALEKYGGEKIVVAIDCRKGYVSIEGWQEDSELKALEVVNKLKPYGLEYIIYTDIEKDGMLQGPNLEALEDFLQSTNIKTIASGGVSSMQDIMKLKNFRSRKLSIDGVIVGKALYANQIFPKQIYSNEVYF